MQTTSMWQGVGNRTTGRGAITPRACAAVLAERRLAKQRLAERRVGRDTIVELRYAHTDTSSTILTNVWTRMSIKIWQPRWRVEWRWTLYACWRCSRRQRLARKNRRDRWRCT